jgi:chemotaxis protein MotB
MSHGGGRRTRHEEHEEHENHERWLVTYADMVTLLMVLFIVMFAMSQVDEKKFMELKNGLAAGFAHSTSVLPGSNSLLEESGTSAMSPVSPQLVQPVGTISSGQSMPSPAEAAAATKLKAMQEVSGLRDVQAELTAALKAKGLDGDVQTTVDDRGLVISLVSKHVTFQANRAELTPLGAEVVDTLGPVLASVHQDIEVSGNTNQAPGAPKFYATDWDLSAARAVTVLRRLNEVLAIPAERLSVAAYGNTRPLVDPSQPGSQAVNKRVDLVLVSGSDEATRKLVEQYAAGQDPAHDTTGTSGTTDATGTTSETTPDTDVHADSALATPEEH